MDNGYNVQNFQSFEIILDLSFNHCIGPIFDSIRRLKHLSMAHNSLKDNYIYRLHTFAVVGIIGRFEKNRLTRIYIEIES